MSKMQSEALVIGRVIGDVVDNFSSTVKMSVRYKCNNHVYNAHQLFPSTLASTPKVHVLGGDMRTFFTLIMTDPDVPGPTDPYLREHLHWKRSGELRNSKAKHRDSSAGIRAVQTEEEVQLQGIAPPVCRDGFSTRKFAEENELGLPVAALFFNCQRPSASTRR
ncbi:protein CENTRORADIALIS [Sesamum angolense]|uniref:Protein CENTRORADIALIS n=1 Tax=Sesamum angolense TaxID=2727404 RepID=A0AAE2BT38_9LAMI|nr:protein CENTRORADIALIS [Sesamum angolense]